MPCSGVPARAGGAGIGGLMAMSAITRSLVGRSRAMNCLRSKRREWPDGGRIVVPGGGEGGGVVAVDGVTSVAGAAGARMDAPLSR